jgi:gamma-glutamyltranspeptidase/glutathione hydrolase
MRLPNWRKGNPVMSLRGMIATANPLASATGLHILMKGGNAVDAAIATAAVLGVVMPEACGLGGDAFMIIFEARSGRLTAINGSGAAPMAATREYFLNQGMSLMPSDGLLSATVPGALDAYTTALEKFGTMELKDLLKPAIGYAEEGFPVSRRLSKALKTGFGKLARHPSSASIFLPGGRALEPGERLVQKALGKTLRLIADGGRDAFYRGEIAEAIAGFSEANGGLFSREDFARHRSMVYEPLRMTYRGYEIFETAPPSQGAILLEELNIIEGFDLSKMGFYSAEAIHLMVEAKKLAFEDRLRYLGDPAFVKLPINQILSKERALDLRGRIDPNKAASKPLEAPPLASGALADSTTSFVVVDEEGNAVSFIQSIFAAWGSGVVAGETGIILNNRGSAFSLEPSSPNCLEPGKRPMHTLNAYAILKDGELFAVGGTPGGDNQVQWNFQVIADLLDFGMNPQEAASAPRWSSFPGTQPSDAKMPYRLTVERPVRDEVVEGLRRRGHRVRIVPEGAGGGAVQLILIEAKTGIRLAGTDPRAQGLAAGY